MWFRSLIADRAYGQLKHLEDGKKKLNLAETLFEKAHKRVRGELSWKRRLAALAVNSLGGILIYNYGKRTKDALANFALGMVVSERQIRTVPKKIMRDYKAYQERFKKVAQTKEIFQDIRVFPGLNSLYVSAFFLGKFS